MKQKYTRHVGKMRAHKNWKTTNYHTFYRTQWSITTSWHVSQIRVAYVNTPNTPDPAGRLVSSEQARSLATLSIYKVSYCCTTLREAKRRYTTTVAPAVWETRGQHGSSDSSDSWFILLASLEGVLCFRLWLLRKWGLRVSSLFRLCWISNWGAPSVGGRDRKQRELGGRS